MLKKIPEKTFAKANLVCWVICTFAAVMRFFESHGGWKIFHGAVLVGFAVCVIVAIQRLVRISHEEKNEETH